MILQGYVRTQFFLTIFFLCGPTCLITAFDVIFSGQQAAKWSWPPELDQSESIFRMFLNVKTSRGACNIL